MREMYSIGEIAGLLGVSRDALRLYEKKGLIEPIKGSNNYRYYSAEDVWNLFHILFYRSINMSLKEILEVSQQDLKKQEDVVLRKIQEEKEQILLHQRYLNKLEMIRQNQKTVCENADKYSLQYSPKLYLMSDFYRDMEYARQKWLESVKINPLMEWALLHGEYDAGQLNRPARICIAMKEEKFQWLKQEVKGKTAVMQPQTCLYTVKASDSCEPDRKDLEDLIREAEKRGIRLKGDIHFHYILNYKDKEKTKYFLEIYGPLKA